jgi:glucose-6-phosphate 1-epimerase
MSNVAELNTRFGRPGLVTIDTGKGNLPRVRVTSPLAEAEVYLHGAHVTHFQPRGHKPVLFMSGASLFEHEKPIRGGVPLVFPWFGPNANDPKLPAHGFARTSIWEIQDINAGDTVTIRLGLNSSEATKKLRPHEFEATFTVTVGASLKMVLEIVNTSQNGFTYEEAMHTYLAVGDIKRTTIDGLAGREFIDKVDKASRKTQPAGAFGITGETDRVYLNTPDTVTVDDAGNERKLVVSKQGSAATVVWNPWVAKSKAMADFGDEEWPGMLCIETANAADNAVTLPPGGRHTMSASVAVTSA